MTLTPICDTPYPVCKHCQRLIKSKVIRTSPPVLDIMLNRAWPASYHPSCYTKARAKDPSLPEVTP